MQTDRTAKKIDPVNSLPGMTSLECASVWIATFMPRLPVRDFEQVQQILLEGAKPGTIEHHAIWDGWEKNANEILEKCQMAIQEMPRQSPCVGFQRSALAAAYQRGFLEKLRFQHEKFFDRIERNRLLLSNRDSLQRAAAGLLAQRCLQEIDDFTIPLLIRTIEFLTAPAKTASYADDLMEHIPVEQKHAIQRALAHLLQRLVQEGGADIATRMVLALAGTGGLRTAFEIFKESRPEEFRSEHLLRVMAVFLQRGKEKLPERARQLLLKVISRKPERMGEILSLMRGLLTEAIAVDWLAFACERHIKGTRSQERDPILRLVLAGEHADGRLGSFFELLANTAFEAAVTSLQPFSVNSERLDALSYWLFPYRELSRLELDPALIYLGAQLSARNVFWQRIRKMPQKYMPSQSDLFLTILAANWSYEAELAGTENSSTHEFLDKLRRIRDGQLAGMNAAAMILSEMLGEALAAGLSSLPSDKAAYAVKTRMSDRWKGLRRGMQAVRGILGARKSKT